MDARTVGRSVHELGQEMDDKIQSGKFLMAAPSNLRAICQLPVTGKRKLQLYLLVMANVLLILDNNLA